MLSNVSKSNPTVEAVLSQNNFATPREFSSAAIGDTHSVQKHRSVVVEANGEGKYSIRCAGN